MANVICPSCGAAGRIPDNFVGRRIKCPKCQEPFTAEAAPPPSPGPKGPAKRTGPTTSGPPPAPPAVARRRPPATPPDEDEGIAARPPAKAPRAPAPPAVARRRTPPPPPPPEDEDVLEELGDEELAEVDAGEPLDEPTSSAGRMDYMRPLVYLRNNPGWFGNAFLTGIAAIIPIVGSIAVQGYLFEVVRYLNRKGDSSYPSFEFGRFGEYLKRGIWPVLAILLVVIPLAILNGVLQFAVSTAVRSSAVSGIGGIFGLIEVFLIVPFGLYAGLSGSLALGAMFRFLQDFYKRVAVETILGLIVVSLINFVLYFLGMLACCVGIIPALGLITLTGAHLFHQLYQLYLARGGPPIPAR